MSNNKLLILLLSISLIMVYIQCDNNDYSNKSALQKQTDSINNGKIDTLNLNVSGNTVTNFNKENIINMQVAYSDEMMATEKYKDFSRNAELEGYHHIALLYKAISLSEKIHASNHMAVLIASRAEVPKVKIEFTINNTKQNLENNIEGEKMESSISYPKFIEVAEKAGNKMAVVSLTYAMKTEFMHHIYYKIALESLNKKTEKMLPKVFYVCPTCGNTFENSAPDRCEFSLTKASEFIKIDKFK